MEVLIAMWRKILKSFCIVASCAAVVGCGVLSFVGASEVFLAGLFVCLSSERISYLLTVHFGVILEPRVDLSLRSFGGIMNEECYCFNTECIAHNLLI